MFGQLASYFETAVDHVLQPYRTDAFAVSAVYARESLIDHVPVRVVLHENTSIVTDLTSWSLASLIEEKRPRRAERRAV